MEGQAHSEIDRIRAAYRERDASTPHGSPWVRPGYRLLMQELEWTLLDQLGSAGIELAGLRVVEVGCGSGYFLSRFLEYGAAHAAGIDLMEDRIALAGERDPRLELVCGDAAALPWADASFDLVTQFTCLSSVLDPGLRRSIASEMWRVARPGGAIVSYDMRSPPAGLRTIRCVASLCRRGAPLEPPTPTKPVELPELRQFFPSTRIQSRSITLATELGDMSKRSVHLARALGGLPFFRTHLLIVANKGA